MTEDKLIEELKNKDEFKRIFIRAIRPGPMLKNCYDKGDISLSKVSESLSEWRLPL